ncbi:uncharacterized protein LOC141849227 [Brevipalpus obovatus]|uniref:uncharacterized protein LOC141849227 n=1 Tax=Brevipalpus obovatus TaxID=246614 RepID=UPI003D9E2A93
MLVKFLAFVLTIAFVTVNLTAENAPFVICKDRPSSSIDVRAEVNPCNVTANQTCGLIRGTDANFTLFFTPTINVTGPIERLIMAKFNKQMKGKDVDVAYGGAVPADNRTFLIDTIDNTVDKGLIAGQKYYHNDLFNVLASSPKTSLWSRYILRTTVPCKKSKCNYLRHPGELLVCVEIPVTLD